MGDSGEYLPQSRSRGVLVAAAVLSAVLAVTGAGAVFAFAGGDDAPRPAPSAEAPSPLAAAAAADTTTVPGPTRDLAAPVVDATAAEAVPDSGIPAGDAPPAGSSAGSSSGGGSAGGTSGGGSSGGSAAPVPVPVQPAAPPPPPPPPPPPAASESGDVLAHTNAQRANAGLGALSRNGSLVSYACTWAAQLAARDSGLAHSSYPGGFSAWAENVASGYGSASSVVDGWMGSSGHRTNMLNAAYTQMGACTAVGASGTRYWVQQFGS